VAWSRREVAALTGALLVAAVILLATSNPGPAQVNDTRAAAVASWSLGDQGELALPGPWPASRNYWGVETPDHRVHVNRFPGVAYWAAPAYAARALLIHEPPPAHPFLIDLRPAAWTAALTVAGALGVAYGLLRRLVLPWQAGLGAAVVGFGTGLWSVAADALWPHGPAALLLFTVLWGWRTGRWPAVAVASAGTVLVRPHLAVALGVLALYAVWRERGFGGGRTAGAIAVGAALGLGLLSVYSGHVFGVWLPTAGYDVGGHLGGLVDHSPWQTVTAFSGALVGDKGVLRFSPVLAVAAAAAVAHRRELPHWTIAAAVAGVAYLLVQVRAVGALGGRDFFGARVSLETVVLATPALVVASVRAARVHVAWRTALAVTAAASIVIHAYGATVASVSSVQVERWSEIDERVTREYGDLRLGDVDLRRPG
jgi:hypothetical protein